MNGIEEEPRYRASAVIADDGGYTPRTSIVTESERDSRWPSGSEAAQLELALQRWADDGGFCPACSWSS